MQVTVTPTISKEQYEVYKRDPLSWNPLSGELTFDANVSPPAKSWRLVYWNGEVRDLFESGGRTWTINNLFCGTEEECFGEIEKRGLEYVQVLGEALRQEKGKSITEECIIP